MLNKLLAATFSWGAYFGEFLTGDALEAANKAISIVTTVLWIIVGVVGLAGVIYAIYLGIQLARAEDQSKRDDAKKHLITVLIALVVTLVLIVFFLYLLPAIIGAFHNSDPIKNSGGNTNNQGN